MSHLHPFTHVFAGHGPEGRDLVLRVRFESHVFSNSYGTGPHDFLDEAGNKRQFCANRYAFSHCLPSEIRNLLTCNAYTWEEKDRNQVANLAVLTPAGSPLISGIHTVIIYYLYPSKVEEIDVEMLVKTCYEKEISFEHRKKREKIRVYVKKACFQQVRIPKN
ncbi:hypothetical protein [Nioella sp. MMSF_3534]|uniref:hypothetical protein n=1 Tax=Nioella sp. MMSF_3534 TaxID=3046720 RepID=UPI00273DFE5C|nr:hypothetical protein [Nioella sp. MMSF_3534]